MAQKNLETGNKADLAWKGILIQSGESPSPPTDTCSLQEIRKKQKVTQTELASRLNLTQPTVSALESADIQRSSVATLGAYISALGGSLEITARFGDEIIPILINTEIDLKQGQ